MKKRENRKVQKRKKKNIGYENFPVWTVEVAQILHGWLNTRKEFFFKVHTFDSWDSVWESNQAGVGFWGFMNISGTSENCSRIQKLNGWSIVILEEKRKKNPEFGHTISPTVSHCIN